MAGLLGLLSLLCARPSAAQGSNGEQLAGADSLFAHLAGAPVKDHARTLRVADSLLTLYTSAHDTCRMSWLHSIRSACFDGLGRYDAEMEAVHLSMELFRPGCDSIGLLSTYTNLSSLYLSLGEFQKVDSICSQALELWNPDWAQTRFRNGLHTNRAIARANMGDLEGALRDFRENFDLATAEGNQLDAYDALSNLGVLSGMAGDLDSADHYFRLALVNATRNHRPDRQAVNYSNLAGNAENRGDHRRALQLQDSALAIATANDDLQMQVKIHLGMARDLFILHDPERAYEHLETHRLLNDSLLNLEKVRALTEMQEKYETEKKARENVQLKAENLAVELDKSRVMRTRNIYLFSGLAVVGIAAGLFNRLQRTRRSRAAIQKEKDISEALLLNILPEEVAAEMKAKGYADAREFDQATILFTDFKGFTTLSEKLTPSELVAEIDHCFKAFDGIITRHGIEKIKTIGDAYMAAGGLPVPTDGRPEQVVLAALEMQEFMSAYKAERERQGRLFFEMRVGIHTGPVIAGIVGVKKYAYDIWGDTVNTASRMESSGAVGHVNISATTYELVKDQPGLRFVHRGSVQAKGKGEMEMWFVERAA